MRTVQPIHDERFKRFCRPQGDPDAIRRLAWRRSVVRQHLLLSLRQERADEELSYIVDHLARIPESAKHRVLAAPETGLYINSLLNGTTPDPQIVVPVIGRLAAASSPRSLQKFSWTGVLRLDYLPVGDRAIRIPGVTLDNPELVIDSQRIRLSSPTGGAIDVPIKPSEQMFKNCVVRANKLELVDGWIPFSDLFDDGNVSVNLDQSSRVVFLRLLEEAVKLINVVMPAALEEMQDTAQYLSPIRPKELETNVLPSFSSPILPGVIFVGIETGDGRLIDARHLAESCLHEHLHNRLYLLDEALPLTIQHANPRSYFSPWKQTMRTIEGMLHAVYVFSHLVWFWSNAGARVIGLAKYAANNVKEQIEHLKFATAEIDTDELTPVGRCILTASRNILENLTRESTSRHVVR